MFHFSSNTMAAITLTIPGRLADHIRVLADGVSVSPHRIGVVAVEMALDILIQDPERLSVELAKAEEARRELCKTRSGGTK